MLQSRLSSRAYMYLLLPQSPKHSHPIHLYCSCSRFALGPDPCFCTVQHPSPLPPPGISWSHLFGRLIVTRLLLEPSPITTSSPSSARSLVSNRFLPVFGTLDICKVCPRAIRDFATGHGMICSLSLPTVAYICMRELPRFHHGPTSSCLHSQPIQAPLSEPGLICIAGQVFTWVG